MLAVGSVTGVVHCKMPYALAHPEIKQGKLDISENRIANCQNGFIWSQKHNVIHDLFSRPNRAVGLSANVFTDDESGHCFACFRLPR